MASKIESYIGFALRKRAVRMGVNVIESLRGGVYLLIVCKLASQNTLKTAISIKNKLKCPLIISNKPLSEITGKENCKLIAIEDMQLSKAIIDNIDDNFSLYSEELNR